MSVRKLMAAAALGGGVALAPMAASAADFSGKTVTIIVPFKEGGGAGGAAGLSSHFWLSICRVSRRSLFSTSRAVAQFGRELFSKAKGRWPDASDVLYLDYD